MNSPPLRELSSSICLILALNLFPAEPASAPKPDASAPAAKSRFGPRDVEVKLQDGSLFRGEIEGTEHIVIKTAYGTLTVPIAEMLRIDRGERLSEKDEKDIAETLKDLDNDEFTKRAAAQYKLETYPAAAYETIKAAREAASPEARSRIDGVLRKLSAKNANKKIQTEDSVRTIRFEAVGMLQLEAFKIKSRLGELAIKLEDLNSVRWLNRGEARMVTLEANAQMGDWIDTGVDTGIGEKIAVAVSGSITPFNNQEISPTGSDNWGNSGPFLMGAVVAKVGQSGEPFLLGYGKVWQTDGKERLFIKINWNVHRTDRSGDGAKGQFTARIATGAWAEEADALNPNGGQ